MNKLSSFFNSSKIPLTPKTIFVGYKEKMKITIDLDQIQKIQFSYGRGIFEIEFNKGKILARDLDITSSLLDVIDKANKFNVIINNGVILNNIDVTDRVTNPSPLPFVQKKK